MLLSLVTATYNRATHLDAMLHSFRRNIPVGIDYEIVLVDGGSTDDTEQIAKAHGAVIISGDLTGAIANFHRGFEYATGRYVLIANDDIVFHEGSIIPAVLHLECYTDCGQVAFADNRPQVYKKQPYDVDVMLSTDHKPLIYGQVSLVRRWIGELSNWWGLGEIEARTYGGDNLLSARIWEYGYTVDKVDGCIVSDRIVDDELRARNRVDDRGFYAMYPDGVPVASKPKPDNPDTETLRVLYLPIYEPLQAPYGLRQRHQKRGLREALSRRAIVWEWDYLSKTATDVIDILRQFKPHIILSQFHGADQAAEIWPLCNRYWPQAIRINWNGDFWPHGYISDPMLQTLKRYCDLQLVVNAAVLDEYEHQGIAAAYWQVAPEPVFIDPEPPVTVDVVFLANNNHAHGGRGAIEPMLQALKQDIGLTYMLFGDGWEDSYASNMYDFEEGRLIYNTAHLAISDTIEGAVGFVSNRFFEALASRACVLQQHVDRFDVLNKLYAGVHYIEWRRVDDLRDFLTAWKTDAGLQDVCENVALEGRNEALYGNHSFDARVQVLLNDLLPQADRKVGGTVGYINEMITTTVGYKGRATGIKYKFKPGEVTQIDTRDTVHIDTLPQFRKVNSYGD